MTIPVHRFAFILLMCLSIPLTSTAQTVTIPDSNLRAVIEVALGKASGNTITTSDMAALPSLEARESNISNLTGLEHAINLTWLNLRYNSISDLSSLAGLTNLTWLNLRYNSISDITSLSGLTNLTLLYLGGNLISDISAVSGLTNLRTLYLWNNNISDISAVSGLTNLTELYLYGNTISDLSALVANTGLGSGDTVDVRVNPLSSVSIDMYIPALQSRGVIVEFDDIVVGVVVNIPDSNLRAVIEVALGKASGNTITTSDMAALPSLEARESNISNLTGLEHAINLTWLHLRYNTISDITSLSGLTNLTLLYLGGNLISDISAVSGLTNLTSLHLPYNSVSDISAVSGLTNLTELYLWNNTISDISAVSGLTNLTELYLSGNTISDITSLSGLTNLTLLNLRYNTISDITSLSGLTNLTELYLSGNTISDITSLSGLTNLTVLYLGDNSVSDISAVSGLTNLRTLGLWNNTISDISAVSGLTNLTVLYLGDNSVSDISAVSGLTNLRTLGLWNNTISDISAVSGLTNLTELYLSGNTISDITSLSGLTNLTELSIWDNTISDITSLSGLTNLTELDLYGNTISDLSPLVANTGLGSGDTVIVRFNPLSSVSIDMYIPALQSRGVTVKFDNQAHPALLKISGNNQRRTPGGTLANPFVVEVQDENGLALAGVTVTFAVVAGGGTLSVTSTTTDVDGRAQSTLTLGPNLGKNTVEVSADGIEGLVPFHAISDTESPPITADVNGDGNVNILDLVLVAYDLGNTGTNLAADVSGDGVVNILDLVLVAGMFGDGAAAPSAHPQVPETLTAVEVQGWLTDARALEVKDIIMKRGFMVLEQLLVALTPRETELLANYPNPFNPETWIPYRLAEDAFVTLTIYDHAGHVVRTLDVGLQVAAVYESRSKAVYWDGRNGLGERMASGVYFYHLSAGDYSATRKMLILK